MEKYTIDSISGTDTSINPESGAFVLRAQLEGISGVTLTVYNGHTRVAEAVDSNNFHAAWADTSRQAVVSVGDILRIEVRDTTGCLIRTLPHEVSARHSPSIHRTSAHIRRPEKKTVLLANYPNPFNPETWLPYQLANDAEVTIRIYSSSGQLVRHLDLGFQQAGYYIGKLHAAYWDGRNDLGERLASAISMSCGRLHRLLGKWLLENSNEQPHLRIVAREVDSRATILLRGSVNC